MVEEVDIWKTSLASRPWTVRAAQGLALHPRRADQLELMDQPGHSRAALSANFRDLARVNRWLGGAKLTTDAIGSLMTRRPPRASLTVLDVAAGCADIPAGIIAWGRKRFSAMEVKVVASDVNAEILSLAPRGVEGISLTLADGRNLPFADRSFDIATCSLVLHHLSPEDAVSMLREMRRVARYGVVVNDLVRNWHGLIGAWVLTRLLTRNPLTRNDAPLSVRRAYTKAEMAHLAAEAGLGLVTFREFLGYRVAMIAGELP